MQHPSETGHAGSIYQELERGVHCARQAHFADAAAHFVAAREGLQQGQLARAIDAFITCHAHYWQSQQALHEASRRFSFAEADQHARLNDLQQILATNAPTGQPVDAIAPPNAPVPGSGSPEVLPFPPAAGQGLPALEIVCFGRFAVRQAGIPIELCQNRKGQTILRFLAGHSRHEATVDVLMDALWPHDRPEIAHHKLHVAISALRRSLTGAYSEQKGGGYILCEHDAYCLNPALEIWIDADEFLACYQKGRQAGGGEAIAHYERACRLYSGPFLQEDLYQDWSLLRREQIARAYLTMRGALAAHHLEADHYAEAITCASAILEENRCDEAAYRYLMRACAALGNRGEALRHYQQCKRVLEQELGVQPMPDTTALFYALLHGDSPSSRANEAEERASLKFRGV